MKLKFKVNLKKSDITVSNIVLSTITYKIKAYPKGDFIELAIVEKGYRKEFAYEIYAICYENNNEYWAKLYSFEKRRRIKELLKAIKKYEDDKELERKIIKVLEKEKERKYTWEKEKNESI